MTIKDLEARCGLDRATIRFYEQEGLIAPKRRANGYRDYSEEEALALEKIAFLRQLGLSIESIRAVQRGELPLGVVLEKQRETILRQQAKGGTALRLCDILRKEGASYNTLQPAKYRAQLLPAEGEKARSLPPPVKSTANWHPGKRWLARTLDGTLCVLLVIAAAQYLLRVRPDAPALDALAPVLGWLAGMVLEPLLLCTWGYTPGKWIMGLRLRTLSGGAEHKPTLKEAFVRYWKVQFFGCGMNLPPFLCICNWNCWKRAKEGEDQPWDEQDFVYNLDQRERDLSWLMAVAWALIVAFIVFLGFDAQRPMHRTDALTRTEYVENVNDLLEYTFDSDLELNEGGVWFSDSISSKGDDRDVLEIREENGLVTGVSMTFTLNTGKQYDACGHRMTERASAALGLLGGSRKVSFTGLSQELDELFGNWEGEIETGGWIIRQTVENAPADYRDFTVVAGYLYYMGETPLAPAPVVHFTIEKTE